MLFAVCAHVSAIPSPNHRPFLLVLCVCTKGPDDENERFSHEGSNLTARAK